MNSIKKNMNTTLKKKTEEKSLTGRTGIRLASKEMFFTACFILNIAHAQKRSGEQIDGSTLKEFF